MAAQRRERLSASQSASAAFVSARRCSAVDMRFYEEVECAALLARGNPISVVGDLLWQSDATSRLRALLAVALAPLRLPAQQQQSWPRPMLMHRSRKYAARRMFAWEAVLIAMTFIQAHGVASGSMTARGRVYSFQLLQKACLVLVCNPAPR